MTILIICLFLLLILPLIIIARNYYVRSKLERLISKKYAVLQDILERLSKGAIVSDDEINATAGTPSLRVALFYALEAHGYKDLFPKEWYTEEKGAESYMVNWLEFPTELGRSPDEISAMKIVTLELSLQMHYYVFQFRSSAPRWAGKLGWMMGVCGPYNDNSLPFSIPGKIFSRFNSVGFITPDDEAKWVHENIVLSKADG